MPTYTIAILENPTTHPFIQILPSLHQHADLTDAIIANGVPNVLRSETIITFRAFEVKFITVSPNVDGFRTALAKYPEIHSIFIVMETNNVDLRATDEKNLRDMLAQIPKAAFPNCCIVNVFEESTVFKPQDAAHQCTDFLKRYCANHGFASPCKHMIVSKKIWQAIVSPATWMATSGARIDFIPKEYCELYTDMKKGFMAVVDNLRNAQPLTAEKLEILACWRRLSDLLDPRRTEETSKLLMSCLSENALTVLAVYARKRNLKSGKLEQADYQREVEFWDVKDIKIATELRILCKLELGVVIPKKTPPKPTVIAEIHAPLVKTPPKPPKKTIPNGSILTVYITGPSDSDKILLLTAISLIHSHKTFDDALKNGKEVKFDESNDHIIDYGSHKIRFVSKESLTKLTDLTDDQVHGFIITISKPDDNELRSSLERLIRSKFQNACIGCMFARTADVEMKTINEDVNTTMAEIQKQHALPTTPQQFCVDKSLVQQILQHKADKTSTIEEKTSTWETMKNGINAFVESVKQLEPVTQADLRIADNWRSLCDAFRNYARNRDLETRRLMATIAENCLSGLAIYCRKNKDDAQPFSDDEWPAAVNHWQTKDAKVASALQTISTVGGIAVPGHRNGVPMQAVEALMKKLINKQRIYSVKTYPCVMLKNYVNETGDELCSISSYIHRPEFWYPITLGKMVKKSSQHITDSEFNEQLNNIRAADMAKSLLHNLKWRLGLPLKYERTTLISANPTEAVNYAFASISSAFTSFQTATSPLEIKKLMETLNDQLIKFVNNYNGYLRNLLDDRLKIFNHDNIYQVLYEINSCIKLQSYRCVNDVFCAVYDNVSDDNGLVIHVTKDNFDTLLNVFKPKGFTTLKFVEDEGQDDNWYAKMENEKKKVSFTRLDLAKDPVINNKATIAYEVPCVNNHDDDYHWICLDCETMIKVNAQARLVCNCGVTKLQATVHPECLQCTLKKKTSEMTVNNIKTTLQYEVSGLISNKVSQIAEASYIMPTRGQKTIEPVSFICTVNNVNHHEIVPTFANNEETGDHRNQDATNMQPRSFESATLLLASERQSVTMTENTVSVPDCTTTSTIIVYGQANETDDQSVTQTSTTLPSKNVMIVGTSLPNKEMLLNHINCVHQHENFDDAVNNAALITFQDSEAYVMDYGTHTICYISRDELGTEEFDIHGCIIVIENNTIELSNATDNHIRNTFSRLPRRAVENCCVVNMFTPSETFGKNDAEQQMRELLTKFCDQHALTDSPLFVCIDTVAMQAILNNSVPADPNVHQSTYAASKRGIEQFLQTIQTVESITPADLEISANWARLCEMFRRHVRNRDEETLRLMATIAENCLTGLAIYCRKNKGGALPLSDDEWPGALSYWSPKDANVAATLQTLKQP